MNRVTSDYDKLGHQALGRPLTEAETALSGAMLKAFAAGDHDFAVVAQRLQEWQLPLPSGAAGPWTVASLEAELRQINISLDQAYAENGIGG